MIDAPRTTTPPPTAAPTDEADRPAPRFPRGGRAVALAGTAVVAVLVVAGCSTSPSSAPPAGSQAPAHAKGAKGVRGTIQAENGSTWTVAARNGKQYTVTLSASTQFGTKAAPATAAQFPVGAQVAVTGAVSGTTVTATRVAAPKAAAPTPGASSAAPAPAPA